MNRAHLAIYVGLLVLLIAGTSHAATFANPFISNCTTISQSGSYVVINNIDARTANLPQFAACINIAADFVTIDLAGHTIFGTGAAGTPTSPFNTGIADNGNHQGIYVHSGVITNFFFGLTLAGSGHTVEHIRAVGNAGGIDVGTPGGLNGHRVVGNVVTGLFTSGGGSVEGLVVACPGVVLENVSTGNVPPDINASGCTLAENSPAP